MIAAIALWMPLVCGVPHLANDVRYLVLPLPPHPRLLAIVACTMLVVLRMAGLAAGAPLYGLEALVVAAWLVATVACSPASRAVMAATVGVGIAIVCAPVQFAAVAAVIHGAVALAVWIVVARPPLRKTAIVLGIVAAGVARAARSDPQLAPFVWLQAVHYALWLVAIPRDAPVRRRYPWLAVAIGLSIVLAAGAYDAAWAKATYLSLATFHIYLELVVLAARGARRRA